MNFNEEMENELKELHLGGKVVPLDEKDKGTPEDWAILEKRIAYCAHENEIMMVHSELLAALSVLC